MIEKDIGFILRRFNFRETSVIATIYTLRFGKISGILKGFYTRKKEFSSPLEVFSLNEFTFYPKKREIWLVSGVDLLCDHSFLRRDHAKAQVAGMCFSLIDRVMQLWDQNPSVFDLLESTLENLENSDERKMLYMFLIKFLTLSGFKPEFNRCISCHCGLEDIVYLSVARGGLLCGRCLGSESSAQKISNEAVSSLRYIQNNDFPHLLRLKPSVLCEEEMISILRDFILFHIGFDVSSYALGRR